MTFVYPEILSSILLVVPLLVAFLWWAWRKKEFLIGQFVQSRLLAELTVGVSKTRQLVRMGLVTAAVILLLTALARPQGGVAQEKASLHGLDILVAMDTSRSLLAQDLKPSRFERAKLAVWDLAQLADRNRFGLIAFSSTAFLQCPLTLDLDALRQNLDALKVGILPKGGSSMAEAIRKAQQVFSDSQGEHKALVIFSDGEDHLGGAVDAAQHASDTGLRIFTVGLGTKEGDLIPIDSRSDNGQFLKDRNGNVVKTRLNEALLKKVAGAGNGFYVNLQGTGTIETLYKNGLKPLPKTEFEAHLIQRRPEQYHGFLAIAILLLLTELFLPERKRAVANQGNESGSLRQQASLLCLALPVAPLLLSATATATGQSPMKHYQNGDYGQAQRGFQQLLEKRPQDKRLHYNLGAAAYKNGRYGLATKHFAKTINAEDLDLQQNAYYNLGNALTQQGEQAEAPAKQAALWKKAIKSFQGAIQLDSTDTQAKENKALVEKKLKKLRQKRSKQRSKSQEGKNRKQQEPKSGDSQKENQSGKQSKQDQRSPSEKKQQQSKQSQSDSQKEQSRNQAKNRKREQNRPNGNNQDRQSSATQSQKSRAERKKAAASMPQGEMTPAQARQLLNTLKAREQSLVFTNALPKTSRSQRREIKEW